MKIQTITTYGDLFSLRASQLVLKEWGEKYAVAFIDEMRALLGTPYATLLVATDDANEPCAITVVGKSEMDFDFWEITWVLVAPKHRGEGLGKLLVQEAEAYAALHRNDFPAERLVMQLTAKIPAYYEAMGYKSVAELGDKALMIKVLSED